MPPIRLMVASLMLVPAFFAPISAFAEESGLSKTYDRCIAKAASTVAMLDCMGAEHDLQDKRLNTAYRKALNAQTDEGKTRLREIQRRWIAEREAECGKLAGATGGTADSLNVSSCFLEKTRQRAQELEALAGATAGAAKTGE